MLDWTVVYCNQFVILLFQCVFFPMLTLSIAVLFAAPFVAGMAHQFNHLSLLFIKEQVKPGFTNYRRDFPNFFIRKK